MRHEWFTDTDFNKLLKKKFKAPYMPVCKSSEQIRREAKMKPEPHFKSRETKIDPQTKHMIQKYDDQFARF